MIEAPEARLLAEQLDRTIRGKRITYVLAGYTPHKFTMFFGDPDTYPDRLTGRTAGQSRSCGGMVEITLDGQMRLVFSDGINLSYFAPGEQLPKKHQLLIGFEDESCLTASVRMYGGIWCFEEGKFDSPAAPYYESARDKPQVLSDAFDAEYFRTLTGRKESADKSAKAFLATGQAIPGLGNGVLQDILYHARIHPKTKMGTLTEERKEKLFGEIKSTLKAMYDGKGRNSETDIFGNKGGYVPFLSKDTAGKNCPRCGSQICKESYLGGSIYYCNGCQPVEKTKQETWKK